MKSHPSYRHTRFYPYYKSLKKLFQRAKENSSWLKAFARIRVFLSDYRTLGEEPNNVFEKSVCHFYPCLNDNSPKTSVDAVYFHQNAWAIGKIVRARPMQHVDIGSHLPSIGILSEIVPVIFVDIRTIPVIRPNLEFRQGTVLNLPFAGDSVESLSSICVIEHIGLGRYGDPIDAFGSEKAAGELQRILRPGGDLYISLPVDERCRIYFNAHRAFTPAYVRQMFDQLTMVEEQYIYGKDVCESYDPTRQGTGLYHLRKNKNK